MKHIFILLISSFLILPGCKKSESQESDSALFWDQKELKNMLGIRDSPVTGRIGNLMIGSHRDTVFALRKTQNANLIKDSIEVYAYFPYSEFEENVQRLRVHPLWIPGTEIGLRFYPILYDTIHPEIIQYTMGHKSFRNKYSILVAVTEDSIIIPPAKYGINTIYNLGGLIPPGKPPVKDKSNLLPE